MDDPHLTNRQWAGNQPARVIIDLDLRLPSRLNVFDGSVKTIVFNALKHEELVNLIFYKVTRDVNLVHQVLNGLYQMKIMSVMIEGGAILIQSFIDEGMWDEARVITNNTLILNEGVPSPILTDAIIKSEESIGDDTIKNYFPLYS